MTARNEPAVVHTKGGQEERANVSANASVFSKKNYSTLSARLMFSILTRN